MRVTDQMTFEAMKTGVGRARAEVLAAQRRASTGLRVEKPSDDPQAAAAARREQSLARRAESWSRSAGTATTTLQASDAALDDVGQIFARAEELAVQGANDTLDAPQR